MNDVLKEAEDWLKATDPYRSNPAILIKSLVVRMRQLEMMIEEMDEYIIHLESQTDRVP